MYKAKLLFRNTNAAYGQDPSAVESMWAYLYGTEKKSTGRFRIRVTKMSAAELIAMGLAPEETPADFYGLQASLDRWNESHGWLPLFDWVGDPLSEINDIERDLGKQFEAFVTGISLAESFGFDLPKPPKPKDKASLKKPFKVPPPEITPDETKETTKKSDPDDFEWL
tara:strand:- start:642 stop:1145 length:504 start_codon:yes stop_codon:yes gene_type:complete